RAFNLIGGGRHAPGEILRKAAAEIARRNQRIGHTTSLQRIPRREPCSPGVMAAVNASLTPYTAPPVPTCKRVSLRISARSSGLIRSLWTDTTARHTDRDGGPSRASPSRQQSLNAASV